MLRFKRLPRIPKIVHQAAVGWWRNDQIRTSPTDGILLTLEKDALISIGDEVFLVKSRSVRRRLHNVRIVYECEHVRTSGILVVTLNHARRSTVIWISDGARSVISPACVSVYSRG